LGTEIRVEGTDEILCELLKHGEELVILEGGKGGRGNSTFKSSVNQTPRQTTEGKAGGEENYIFTLKTIADVGLVGFPNAGKSTLLNTLSNATPKIASYPFTTLVPTVGIIDYPEEYRTVSMADVPGLIEGAAENRGLGHRFLRHVERCNLLVFLIDLSAADGREPWEDFVHLRQELEDYDPLVAQKPFLFVGNKIDEDNSAKNLKLCQKKFPEIDVLPISAILEEGLDNLRTQVLEKLSK
jgi:GTP-binding protein